jgi:hypothetical protein
MTIYMSGYLANRCSISIAIALGFAIGGGGDLSFGASVEYGDASVISEGWGAFG